MKDGSHKTGVNEEGKRDLEAWLGALWTLEILAFSRLCLPPFASVTRARSNQAGMRMRENIGLATATTSYLLLLFLSQIPLALASHKPSQQEGWMEQ